MRVLLSVMMALGCAVPALAQVPTPSAALDAAFDAARALSPTARQLEASHRDWLHYRALDEYGEGAEGDDERIAELQRLAARDQALLQTRLSLGALPNSCVGEALKGCSSSAGGWLTSPDGQTLYWQLQEGVTEETGITGGFVLLVADPGATLHPVAWAYEGYRYEAPVLLAREGVLYVAVVGRMQGTGNGNADVIFRWTPEADAPLIQVDNWSWHETLTAQLPEGLEVWKGLDFRYGDEGAWAWTPLWREGDGNCCASGGSAGLTFVIRDDVLVLDHVSVQDAIAEAAMSEPIAVLDFVARAQMCTHWGGEEPYDAERRAQIEAAVTELRCETLEGDAQQLRVVHADRPATLALIRRVSPE